MSSCDTQIGNMELIKILKTAKIRKYHEVPLPNVQIFSMFARKRKLKCANKK